MSDAARRPFVPESLLGRFADASGRVMMERRDRTRRLTASVAEAAAAAGFYTVGAPDLTRLLIEVEEHAAKVVGAMLAGAFPPRGEDRVRLALFVAFQLQLGRGPRAVASRVVEALTEVVVEKLPEEEGEEDLVVVDRRPAPEPRGTDAGVRDDEGHPVSLSVTPELARLLMGRTWQLVRFPEPRLLTGDTPAVPWSPSGAAPSNSTRFGAYAEVRLPLDPRHALILARSAQLGEVIRDLGDRHASALNRTVADAAATWMYYHPDTDPLGGVALDPT